MSVYTNFESRQILVKEDERLTVLMRMTVKKPAKLTNKAPQRRRRIHITFSAHKSELRAAFRVEITSHSKDETDLNTSMCIAYLKYVARAARLKKAFRLRGATSGIPSRSIYYPLCICHKLSLS